MDSLGKVAEQMLKDAPICNCPRCGDKFAKAFFMVCGGCLGDIDRMHKNLPPTHFIPCGS